MKDLVIEHHGTQIGAFHFRGKKKPRLCEVKDNVCFEFAIFPDDGTAENFIYTLANFIRGMGVAFRNEVDEVSE